MTGTSPLRRSPDICRYLSGSPPVAISPDSLVEPSSKVTLAILPFRILGDQTSRNAFLAPGITETIITKLSRIERLSIPPPSVVLKYAEGIVSVRAAKELRIEYVLEGSLHIFGESVRASVQLVFAEAGIAVWAGQFEATEETLPKLEESIAEQVANAVLPHLSGEERAEISRSGTNGGPAHAGIADYYLRMGLWGGLPQSESFAAAIRSAETAVSLEPTLGDAHASLAFAVWAYHRDEQAAEKHFNLAVVRNPNYASAHHWYGHLNSARNRPELAIANLERAQKVDLSSVLIAAALGFVYYNARQFNRALDLVLNAARELPQSGIVHEMLT
jgi:TolB-like protein